MTIRSTLDELVQSDDAKESNDQLQALGFPSLTKKQIHERWIEVKYEVDRSQVWRTVGYVLAGVALVLACIFVWIFAVVVAAFIYVFRQKWASVLHAITCLFITFILVVISMVVDSPTLVYGT